MFGPTLACMGDGSPFSLIISSFLGFPLVEDAYVVGEVLIRLPSPEGGAPKGVPEPQENTRVQEPPPCVNYNSLSISLLLSHS